MVVQFKCFFPDGQNDLVGILVLKLHEVVLVSRFEAVTQPLQDAFAFESEVKVAEDKERNRLVFAVVMKSIEGVLKSSSSGLAITRRLIGRPQHGDDVAGVVEQVDVDEVDGRFAESPSRPQIAFSRPTTFGEEAEREFVSIDEAVGFDGLGVEAVLDGDDVFFGGHAAELFRLYKERERERKVASLCRSLRSS